MKTLILMRHAKSSWDVHGQPDHDRSLNQRGVASARAMGAWLRKNRYMPDQLVSSSSQRTRKTADHLALDCPAVFENALYHASAGVILNILKSQQADKILLLGHNPGFADVAAQIVCAPPDHPKFAQFPTCATLVVQADIATWEDVKWGCGAVTDFAVPREVLQK